MARQPIYVRLRSLAGMGHRTEVHSPGSYRGGKVRDIEGWVNSKAGEMGQVCVRADEDDVGWTYSMWVDAPRDAQVTWDGRRLMVVRREVK